jgi:predicted SprT family Zn-dependent metalloprotease
MTKFPPREGDKPREVIMQEAQETVDRFTLQGINVEVFFKYTCQYCGERVTFNQKMALYEEGECCACGKITEVLFAGYSLHIHYE